MEIVKEFKKELRTISKHVLAVAQHNDEAFENIQRALNDIQDAFEKADEKYLSLKKQVETNYEQHKKETLASMKNMKDEIAQIECQSQRSATSISNCGNELEEVQTCVSEIRTEQRRENAEIKSHVSDLNAKLGYCNTEINDVKQSMQDIYDNVSSNTKEIEAIKVHLSNDRPRDKLFFYPPNRIAILLEEKKN
jgi:chromosome segregation ATPase